MLSFSCLFSADAYGDQCTRQCVEVGTSMEKMKAHDGVKRYENSGDDETSATMGATG
ncbi:hypothetical protein PC129_g2531 [Phytophthora cactorum]|uniref:Uncharacterized protein n=1 Tax=Phytophthora cactorum TaxID=29920 RepID=A0A8T1A2T7_9STRA|nr:hypothetical protein Pcac1_g309 [Phytophthora cactorum]KAG2848762.1 hypothetical protein PC111_g258 [Phytophthora cactorum]KAG2849145.1 hypothetical protein PC112_g408 [Phytophthora cactorum]KAG2869115.1 hypothetical protein PC113_g493 [Phytophthora cactorum]KAG2935004.1 hypothetical protein PC114_g770 [Phytophthora cactorum]